MNRTGGGTDQLISLDENMNGYSSCDSVSGGALHRHQLGGAASFITCGIERGIGPHKVQVQRRLDPPHISSKEALLRHCIRGTVIRSEGIRPPPSPSIRPFRELCAAHALACVSLSLIRAVSQDSTANGCATPGEAVRARTIDLSVEHDFFAAYACSSASTKGWVQNSSFYPSLRLQTAIAGQRERVLSSNPTSTSHHEVRHRFWSSLRGIRPGRDLLVVVVRRAQH